MDKIEKQAIFGRLPDWAHGVDIEHGTRASGAEGSKQLGLIAWNRCQRVLDDHLAARARIEADVHLSDKGKQARLAELAAKAPATLGLSRQHLVQLQRGRDQVRAEVEAGGPELSDVLAAALWPLIPPDRVQVGIAYRDAIARADYGTCLAIERLPTLHPGCLEVETLAELRRERIAKTNPAGAERLELHDRVVADVAQAIDAAAAWFAEATGQDAQLDTADNAKVA